MGVAAEGLRREDEGHNRNHVKTILSASPSALIKELEKRNPRRAEILIASSLALRYKDLVEANKSIELLTLYMDINTLLIDCRLICRISRALLRDCIKYTIPAIARL